LTMIPKRVGRLCSFRRAGLLALLAEACRELRHAHAVSSWPITSMADVKGGVNRLAVTVAVDHLLAVPERVVEMPAVVHRRLEAACRGQSMEGSGEKMLEKKSYVRAAAVVGFIHLDIGSAAPVLVH